MAITIAAAAVDIPSNDEGTRDRDEAKELRQKIKALIHERDRAVDLLESAAGELKVLKARHRHHLGLQCDHPGCGDSLSVSSARGGGDGQLATALMGLALVMRWHIGSASQRALGAFTGSAFDAAITVKELETGDRCPLHCPR